MTTLDQITHEAEALTAKERKRALELIRSIRPRGAHQNGNAKAAGKSSINKSKLHPAVRAIAGMWKDRSDLPKEGAAASKILRRRLMGRKANG